MAAYTTIDDPSAHFKVQLYTGDGNDGHAITFDDTDTDMSPDLVLLKGRSFSDDTTVFDTTRGANKWMATNRDYVSDDNASPNFGVKSFDSDGFTLGAWSALNRSSETHVAWCWKESAGAGFEIVAYTGNATGRTISHSLSAVPHLMLIKNRSATGDWMVYHHKNTSAPETDYLYLNLNSATQDSAIHFNDTAPTSSVFSVGTGGYTNGNTNNIIAYLFSEKQGFSKFGSYKGNGNADGTFVYTGFRPALVMAKYASPGGGVGDWNMYDNKRKGYNAENDYLAANATSAENSSDNQVDLLSNGFKWRATDSDTNESGSTYVYMAFAEAPFVNSSGVPCNAR